MRQNVLERFIVIEGPDGIGKTKQSSLLVDWFNNEYDSRHWTGAIYYKELNDTTYIYKAFRELVYNLYNNVSTKILADIIKLNRYVLQQEIVKHISEDEDSDMLYIVDRWNISTYNYLKAERYSDKNPVYTESECLQYLLDENTYIPGLTIMLVGYNGINRKANRQQNNMFEDRDKTYDKDLTESYIYFDESLYAGKVIKINNDKLTVSETQNFIRQCVISYLNNL